MTTKNLLRPLAAATALLSGLLSAPAALAQDVTTLKVHFFLPATSYAATLFIQPWCDKIARESANRMKCQLYPSMQLGGTPPQLYDQARDGVADVVWTLPGYTAGRFPSLEAFELPFMMQNPEATSKALCRTPKPPARRCGTTRRNTAWTSSRTSSLWPSMSTATACST